MAEELCTGWFRIVAGTVGKTPFLTLQYSASSAVRMVTDSVYVLSGFTLLSDDW